MSGDKIYQNSDLKLSGKDKRIAIVAARFNSFIVDPLVTAAVDALESHDVNSDDIVIHKVPGAFELPIIAQKLASTDNYDAVICFGCVIRGDTPHFDYVCNEASRGIQDVSLQFDLPVIFGLLTVNTEAQALERIAEGNNKGVDAALAAIETLMVVDDVAKNALS